jgi:hypothetical protein
MRMTTYLASACLMLLGTIALAQSVTYDYDRAANFCELQDLRVDSRHRADRRSEPRACRASH